MRALSWNVQDQGELSGIFVKICGNSSSLFSPEETQKVLEAEVLKMEKDEISMDFHYCPLVAAWQKLGCSQEDIEHLCDIAMDGDRGIAEECGFDFTIHSKIAEGADTCRITFRAKR